MQLSRQQLGYVIAAAIGAVAIVLVTVILLNAREARQPLLDRASQLEAAQTRVTQGLEACAQEQTPERCREQVATREAQAAQDARFCEALEGTSGQESCVTLAASAALDREMCNQLKSDARDRCEDTVLTARAQTALDLRLCDGVSDAAQQAACTQSVQERVVANGTCAEHGVDPFLCDEQDVYQRAVDAADLATCDRLSDETLRRSCQEDVRGRLPDPDEGEQDSDGDGLSDSAEASIGTRPDIADTDNDGLSDGEEVQVYATDPLAADTDGDGFPDGQEVQNGFDPNGDGAL